MLLNYKSIQPRFAADCSGFRSRLPDCGAKRYKGEACIEARALKMVKLANIFEDSETAGPRGADLEIQVCVAKSALGRTDGVLVDVPLTVEGIRRADPHGDRDKVRLHLPAELPKEGAVLRLRGLGGKVTAEGDDAQAPGDLYVRVTVDSESSARRWPYWLLALASGAGAAAALVSLLS